jgi:hypothetical protein
MRFLQGILLCVAGSVLVQPQVALADIIKVYETEDGTVNGTPAEKTKQIPIAAPKNVVEGLVILLDGPNKDNPKNWGDVLQFVSAGGVGTGGFIQLFSDPDPGDEIGVEQGFSDADIEAFKELLTVDTQYIDEKDFPTVYTPTSASQPGVLGDTYQIFSDIERAPEIDPGSMAGALTLLSTGVLMLTSRRRRNQPLVGAQV